MVADSIIVGAGISGLARAWAMGRSGGDVAVWDAGPTPGGAIRTIRQDGFLIEAGPNSLQNGDARLRPWIEALGLGQDLLAADRAASRRYICLHGRPVPTPASPLAAIRSPLLSTGAKLRILREPFIPKRPAGGDESLADMVRRRLGPEPLAHLIDPMVAGIYAGDPETLSVRHAFPKLYQLEQDFGSFVRGAIAKKKGGPAREILSFRDGLQTLTDRLAHTQRGRIHPSTRLESLEHDGSRFRANGTVAGRVVITAPPHAWPGTGILAEGAAIQPEYAPVVSLSLGFRAGDIRHPIDGFGMLVPRRENRNLLGVLFPSAIFPGRAPEGHHLLTCFIGGARQPELTGRDDDRLVTLALDELRVLLGVDGTPVTVSINRWEKAIPQYRVGYDAFLNRLKTLESRYPGLSFGGNYVDGIGIDRCITAALP
jgi:oxygen-dependent protoporphyrinogen oxidase